MTDRTDRNTPRIHVRPASGWCNDPNGPLFHDGRYHLFFQHNPAAPVWGDIHWGHTSSPDLVRWTDHGIALTPTPGGPDAIGAWSGCAVVEDGVPTAVYTGMDRTDGIGSVMLARATDDAITTLKAEPAPVVPGPPPGLDLLAFRDPFLFTYEGQRWAVIGAGHRTPDGGRPDVLLYRVDSLTEWTYAGSLLDADHPLAARHAAPATAWECPALVPAGDGRWILLLSLWADDITYGTTYLIGDLAPSGTGLTFVPSAGGMLDHGRDFYAPTALAREDRNLLWGWSWESRTEQESIEAGWAGCLTHPREIGVHEDGTLRIAPAPELTGLRGTAFAAGDELPAAYDIEVDVAVGLPDSEVELRLGNTVALRLNPMRGLTTLDRTAAPAASQHPLPRTAQVTAVTPSVPRARLRILVDGPLVEVFVNERAMLTEKVYPAPEGTFAVEVVRGTAEVRVAAWELTDH
ncbi:glycoside hydrolase family 32 protein [Streptomyces sp. NPDC001661]